MKPSKGLKTFLWVSELKETRAKEEFQRAKRALLELKEMLEEITKRPRELYDGLPGKTFSGTELSWFAETIERTLQEKERVEKILQEKRREVESLRQKAVKLYQRRRMAETLYQKAKEAYLKESEEKERKEVEDLILMGRERNDRL